MEITCPIRMTAARRGGDAAVRGFDGVVTYAELDRLVADTSDRLLDQGLREGDRLVIATVDRLETIILLFAAFRLGLVACPVSTRLPQAAVRQQADQIDSRAIFTDVPGPSPGPTGGGPSGDAMIDALRPATIVFTSGSTGGPKAALHSFANHYYSALGSNENITLEPGDSWLLSLPLYHVGGIAITVRCFLAGAAVVLPAERWDDALDQVTHVSLVSTQLRRLLYGEDRGASPMQGMHRAPIGSFKAVLLGGGAIPPSLLDAALEARLPVHTSYGMTETASQVTATAPGAARDELSTSGRVLSYREARIGDGGEILVRGETRFLGYVTRDGLERPFDDDGWFATGDLGRIDERGRLNVVGRIDNMMVSGGENIAPEEIEAALSAHESVSKVVVVPVEDAEYGQRPVAFVSTAAGAIDEAGLRDVVAASLPRFMIPDAFYAWPEEAERGRLKVDRSWFRRRAEALRRGV